MVNREGRRGRLRRLSRRLRLRTGRAARRLAADRLAAQHRYGRGVGRARLGAASHFTRTFVIAVCRTRESSRQSLSGEGEKNEDCGETLEHCVREIIAEILCRQVRTACNLYLDTPLSL